MSAKIPCFVQLDFFVLQLYFLGFIDYADFLIGHKSQVVESGIHRNGPISCGC